MGPQPAHPRLHVVELGRERCGGADAIVDGGRDPAALREPLRLELEIGAVAAAPGAAVHEDDRRARPPGGDGHEHVGPQDHTAGVVGDHPSQSGVARSRRPGAEEEQEGERRRGHDGPAAADGTAGAAATASPSL